MAFSPAGATSSVGRAIATALAGRAATAARGGGAASAFWASSTLSRERSLSLPGPGFPLPYALRGDRESLKIAVALSGGVDSAVAACLLRDAGHEVRAVFMRTWDERDEKGVSRCTADEDLGRARRVADRLGLELVEVDFVSAYWQRVFEGFLDELNSGATPNPDLACNRYIKFDALRREVESRFGPEWLLATGHYARVAWGAGGPGRAGPAAALLRGMEPEKDQSYFLASVRVEELSGCVFPLGTARSKADVRAYAAARDLVDPSARSSAGICFVGRRDFGSFLAEYLEPRPGLYRDVDSGRDLGPCRDLLAVTVGQRAGVGGGSHRLYVAGKDMAEGVAWLAAGPDHPALRARSVLLEPIRWLSAEHASRLATDGSLACGFQARYRQRDYGSCVLSPDVAEFAPTVLMHLDGSGGLAGEAGFAHRAPSDRGSPSDGRLVATAAVPIVAATPGQEFVLYEADRCLGAAPIALVGETEWERERRLASEVRESPASDGRPPASA